MNEVPLLINIAAALVVAFIGGMIVRRLGLPTIIGYLLAGIAIGPFTPGFVGDIETISQLAELGVILLMFGVGLSISLKDLWKVKDIAIPGSLSQMAVATLLGYGLSQMWGWSSTTGIVLGLAISNASSVVMLRGLMDNSLLNTTHGQAAIGWSIIQDLVTVMILVLLPSLSGPGLDWQILGLAALKAMVFVALVLFVGTRLIPWLLRLIAHTRSRELFILAILAIALGTALGSAELFGVSLALGAFVAGVVISESPLSHQVGADILPFRDAFAVLFFVSIGMLVNPAYLLGNIGPVLALTALISFGKPLLITLMGFVISRPARTTLVVAAGNSQIGEFSFVLGQAGLALGLLSRDQYSLILAGALVSITLNPGAFRLLERIENGLKRFPRVWRLLDRHGPAPAPLEESVRDHVVVVGYGRVGQHIINILEAIKIPQLVIEADVERVEELNRRGTITLFGDAANSEVITHAGLERARALVVTTPEEATSQLIVAAARDLAPDLPIVVRAATEEGVTRLAELGAQDVIHPELEGGLEIVRHTLLRLGLPLGEINRYTDAVRQDHYDLQINTEEEHRMLHNLLSATSSIEVTWLQLPTDHPIVGQTLAEADLRARTGASVIAIMRNKHLMANPKSLTVFEAGDRIGLIGDGEQIKAVEELLAISITKM
ncbi:MAG TPA: cation:proton antiporter [Anaerolineales bacterium]|nr:cation:proton antiporter [Anaerolineales bacterium]